MGANTAEPERFKFPLLFSIIDTNSHLGSTTAALNLKIVYEFSWESVIEDLIQEFRKTRVSVTWLHVMIKPIFKQVIVHVMVALVENLQNTL